MGADRRDSQVRCLVHFPDGGSAMRYRADTLAIGDELDDGPSRSPRSRAPCSSGRSSTCLRLTAARPTEPHSSALSPDT